MTWGRFAMLYGNSLQTETGTNFTPQRTSLLRFRQRLPNIDPLAAAAEKLVKNAKTYPADKVRGLAGKYVP